MMAQEMYEENKVLESQIESLKSLITDLDDFLRECNPQSDEDDRRIGELQERIRNVDEDEDEEEVCEECRYILEDCECED